MSVLSWRQQSGLQVNMFTHIRHRRVEALGPWADIPDETWSSESICLNKEEQSEEFWLHTIDAPFERCHEMVKHILETGALEIDGRDIRYELDFSPRRHWAYRNEYTDANPSVSSPFSRHSAEVHEYWSFNEIFRERWIKLLESPPSKLKSLLARLRFPLDRRSDRIGNLIISGAEDAIDCDLSATHDGKLVFKVVEGEPALGEYTATIWAAHGDDAVLRRQFEVTREEIAVGLQSDVDHIGFALYRNADGQCIDLMDEYLIMEVSFAMHIDSGPTFHVRDLKGGEVDQFNPGGARHTFGVELDEISAARDRKVRRAVLDRKVHDREHRALQDGSLKRFDADQSSEAVDHFLNLLRQHSYQPEPIYLADPFFMDVDSTGPERKLILGMIEATAGRPLRILCAPHSLQKPWWTALIPPRSPGTSRFEHSSLKTEMAEHFMIAT